MRPDALAERLERLDALDAIAVPAQRWVKKVIPPGTVKDWLHGLPLGHPAHPLLTDIPIGMFTTATTLDLLGGRKSRRAADLTNALGLLAVAPTVAAGAADWSETGPSDRRVGVVHAAANFAGTLCYTASLWSRLRGRRARAAGWGLAGMSVMTVGGYLGGHLGFAAGVGVNHAQPRDGVDDWTAVAAADDLPAGAPTVVELHGEPVLVLLHHDGRIDALADRCAHAGGPLHEGTVADGCVTCPWHGSVFRLADGTPVHGPTAYPQPAFEARVAGSKVELRRIR